jgi:signal transduction histidine kinase
MSFFTQISAPKNHPSSFRLGIIAGFLVYSAFAFLDFFMLPSHYIFAWKIRFLLVGPSLIIPLILSYYTIFQRILGFLTYFLLVIAQLGIFLMIFVSFPYENAYHDYYVGLLLVILWAAFIFKMDFKLLISFVIITWLIYIYHVIFNQGMLSHGFKSNQFSIFINNIFFLVSMSSVAVIGSYLIDEYYRKLNKEKENLILALEKAEESDQTKTNFLSTMSHEIRTPLNAIIGFSDIMVNELKEPENQKMISAINRQAYQLLTILTSILNYTEIQSKQDLGKFELLSMQQFQMQMDRLFIYHKNSMNKQKILFEINIHEDMRHTSLNVPIDNFLELLNVLLENAVKFSTDGLIAIHLKPIHNNGIILSIYDEGLGLSEDYSEDIFDSFYQLERGHSRKYGGIGLGLTFAKKIVTMLDGDIWYKRNQKKGTTFHIHIPQCVKFT